MVVISVAAEPASGSVMAIAQRMRPSQIGRSQRSCCSVVPSTQRWLAVPVPLVCISPALRGSYLAILVVAVLGSFCFSAMGVLLGSRARTIEALSGLVNLTIMPMWIVSGVFFSAQRFPEWLQPLIQALPLTAFVNAMRAIQLQGAGLVDVWQELAILAGWLIAAFVASRQLFKWQ